MSETLQRLKASKSLPDEADDAAADRWSSIDTVQLVQCLCVLLDPHATEDRVENAVKRNHSHDQHIAVEFHFVHSHDEAVALRENREQQSNCRAPQHVLLGHFKRSEDEVAHLLRCLRV